MRLILHKARMMFGSLIPLLLNGLSLNLLIILCSPLGLLIVLFSLIIMYSFLEAWISLISILISSLFWTWILLLKTIIICRTSSLIHVRTVRLIFLSRISLVKSGNLYLIFKMSRNKLALKKFSLIIKCLVFWMIFIILMDLIINFMELDY